MPTALGRAFPGTLGCGSREVPGNALPYRLHRVARHRSRWDLVGCSVFRAQQRSRQAGSRPPTLIDITANSRRQGSASNRASHGAKATLGGQQLSAALGTNSLEPAQQIQKTCTRASTGRPPPGACAPLRKRAGPTLPDQRSPDVHCDSGSRRINSS